MERQTTVTIDRLQLSDPGENLKARGKERELVVSLLFSVIKTELRLCFVTEILLLSPEGNHLLVALEGGMCEYRYVRSNCSAVRGQRATDSVEERRLVACDHIVYFLHAA